MPMLKLTIGDFEEGKGPETYAFVRSVSAAMREIGPRRPVLAADDKGSFTIWMQDGLYIAEFHQWLVTKNRITATHKAKIGRFLKKWWPVMTGEEE